MSWTHYNHPIFVGAIKSRTPTDGNLLWRNYIIGDTSGYTLQKSWNWPANTTMTDFCAANGLTLHYVESGDGGNTTNITRGFTTFGPEAVVLDPYTTESDLSGLTGLTNAVTHIHDKTDTDIYEINSSCRFVLANDSTLNHDPDHEHLILTHLRPNDGSLYYTTFLVSHDARYNYGVTYTSNGRTTYSIGTGLFITGDGMDNWNPRDTAFGTASNTQNTGYGLFVCRGGTIACSKAIAGGSFDVIRTTFNGTRTAGNIQEWRSFGSVFSYFDGRISNYSLQYIDPGTNLVSMELNQGLVSENLGTYQEFTLRDFDVSNNPYVVDIGPDSPLDRGHRDYLVINSKSGSDIIAMWRDQRTATSQKGNVVTSKEVSFNIYDTTAQPIEGCKMYLVDNPSDAAKDVTYTAGSTMKNTYHSYFTGTNGSSSGLSSSVTIVSTGFDAVTITAGAGNTKNLNTLISEYNADSGNTLDLTLTEGDGTQIPLKNIVLGAKPKPTLLPRVQFHDDGTISYNYANPIEYEKTTDANGNVATFQIITSTQLKPFTSNTESTEASAFYDNYNNGWKETDGAGPVFADWDTDRFGKYYKVDRRSDSNTNLDDFTFNFCSYNHLLSNTSQNLKGVGELTFDWILVVDSLIAQTDKTTVDNYIAITDSERFYDRAKSYLTDNYAGEENTLVTRSGLTIDAGDKNIVLNPTVTDAASAFAFDSGTNTLTIKCTSFTGNLTTTGTITVQSGVTVLGTIVDVNNPAGLASRTFSVSNVILGTTIQIYNETQVTKRGTTESYSPANVFETLIASGTTTDSTLIGDGSSTIAQLITAAGNGLEADPMADTSYVLPSGWKLETTEVAGDNNRVTITGIYDEGTVPNGDFNIGDSVRIRATCAAAAGAFLPFVNTTIANEGGFSMRVDQQADTIYNDNGIDGSASDFDTTTLTIAPDYTNFEIDVTDTDDPGVVTVQQIYAKYAYLITTTEGIENFFGAITAENPTNFRINVDVVDLKIQNVGSSDMIITGARLYRSDFTTVITKGSGGGTLSHDTGELVQFIRPQVESAIDLKGVAKSTDTDAIKTDTEAVKKKTNLIPGLL